MEAVSATSGMADAAYRVYGLDRNIYGPVSGTTLLEWAKDGRVQAATWVYSEPGDAWKRAEDMAELAVAFPGATVATPESPGNSDGPAESKAGVASKVLTRLKAFSDMSAEELAPFAREMMEQVFRPFTYIVQQGSHGDAMYFVIQGKVGVSTRGQVTESFLVALNIGETFGEMSLFDPGPRSADVRAENDVIVLKLTSEALGRVCREAPAAGNKFLWNVARQLSARMRSMDKRAASAKDLDAAGKAVR
ncbi:MAG: cyclic nucleotide-binding domain-containing protein [Verrucomicrobiales bacterium]|nr:cyclic nucleotide-binding domain-containing protein [Verrucomicrobiales bacterium]